MASATESHLNGFQLSFSENLGGNIMLENLRQQRELKKFCDIVLVVGGSRRFPAHRSVLAASSPYFDSLLKNHPITKEEIDIPWQDVNSFSLLLDYMYSGEIVITDKNVKELLKLATDFAIPKLKGYCEQYSEKAKKSSSSSSQSNFKPSSQSTSSSLNSVKAMLEKRLNFPTINKAISFENSGDSSTTTNVNTTSTSANISSSKGPAPMAPPPPPSKSPLTSTVTTGPPLPSQPPSVRRSNSQSSNRQVGRGPKPPPPSSKPPPPPKTINCINGFQQQLSPSSQTADGINRRQSFNAMDYNRQHSKTSTSNSNFNHGAGFDGGSIPPPPPLPPPSFGSGGFRNPSEASKSTNSRKPSSPASTLSNHRNNSIPNEFSTTPARSSFLHSHKEGGHDGGLTNVGVNSLSSGSTGAPSLSSSNRSISKSSQSISGRPSVLPPPPPSHRTISTGANINSLSSNQNQTNGGNSRSHHQSTRGAAPLPPPSQTILQVQVFTNSRGPSDLPNRQGSFSSNSKSHAPVPPVRNTSISKIDLESRYRDVFRDPSQLPRPEAYRGLDKYYPSGGERSVRQRNSGQDSKRLFQPALSHGSLNYHN